MKSIPFAQMLFSHIRKVYLFGWRGNKYFERCLLRALLKVEREFAALQGHIHQTLAHHII